MKGLYLKGGWGGYRKGCQHMCPFLRTVYTGSSCARDPQRDDNFDNLQLGKCANSCVFSRWCSCAHTCLVLLIVVLIVVMGSPTIIIFPYFILRLPFN